MRAAVLCCLAVVVLSAVALADDYVVLVDDDVDFSTLRTFAIADVSITSRHPALDSPLVASALRAATQQALTARGLSDASAAPALSVDVRVRGVDFGIDRMGRPVEQGRGRRNRQPNPNQREFTEGTLVIDVARTDTRALIWRGVYHDTEKDPSKVAASLSSHTAKLLSEFPRQRKP